MRHLINVLQKGLFINDEKLLSTFSLLSHHINSNLSINDMNFLINTTSGSISLFKLFTHIKNINSTNDDLLSKIDKLILSTFGKCQLHQLKIKLTHIKMKVLNSLIELILNIPINEITINMSSAPIIDAEKNINIHKHKLSLLLSPSSDQLLFNSSVTTLICDEKTRIKPLDIYRGLPLIFDELTSMLSLLLKISVTKIWQTKHSNPGYVCQMIIVNLLQPLFKRLIGMNKNLKMIINSIKQLNGIESIEMLDNYLNQLIKILGNSQIKNSINNNQNLNNNDNNNNNNNNKLEYSMSNKYKGQLYYLTLIKNNLNKQENVKNSMIDFDELILSKLREELFKRKINIDLNNKPLLFNNLSNNDNNNCYNLNRLTLKMILKSYSEFEDNVKLSQFHSIACPLLYKQCITIFPFYNGKNINILQSNCNGDSCTKNEELLSLIPNPIYNPADISSIVIEKLQFLIKFIKFDGNYKNFENIIRLISFNINDLSSILTILYSMQNIVYVTISAAIYAYHLSINNTFQIYNMYYLTCLLGPDAYTMQLHTNLNLPLININHINQLHLLPINILFPANMKLCRVNFKNLENLLITAGKINNSNESYWKYVLLHKNIPEYTIWLYLLIMKDSVESKNDKYDYNEYCLYKILQNIVENPYELDYIEAKLHSNYHSLQANKRHVNNSDINDDEDEVMYDEVNEANDTIFNKYPMDEKSYKTMRLVNQESEQYDVGAIYGKLIAANYDIKNDIGELFLYALQNEDNNEFIGYIKEYLANNEKLLETF